VSEASPWVEEEQRYTPAGVAGPPSAPAGAHSVYCNIPGVRFAHPRL